jgi:lactate racemase
VPEQTGETEMNKRFDLKYGDRTIAVEIPLENLIGVINGKEAPTVRDILAAVRNAMVNPIGCPLLGKIVHAGESVCILASDLTRSWHRGDQIIPVVVDKLNALGVPDKDITVLIAVGSHRAQTRLEHAMLVTPEILGRVRVVEHDCRKSEMTYIGTTPSGIPVHINKIAADADRLILTGGIVTHDMAGYGGGMKSVLPGIASYETIMAHHKCSLGEEPGTLNDELCCEKKAGNPFYERIVEAGLLAKPDFLVNSVINPEGKIGRVVAGDPMLAHESGCESVDSYFNTPIHELADLVVASCGGFPTDINFYQSTKSLNNAASALKPGGTLVLFSESRELFGHPYVELIATGFADNIKRHSHLLEDYDIGKWVGFMATVFAERYHIVLVSSLSDDQVRMMGMVPAHSPAEAMRLAHEYAKPDARTYVVPNASGIWPVLTV